MLSYLKKKEFTSAQFLVLGYFIVIFTGTILLMLPLATTAEGSIGFLNALFTSTSATCVTGLIVVNTSTAFTVFGQLVIMFLIQIGGIGIMTMSSLIALVIGRKIGLKERLLIKDDLDHLQMSGMVRLVKYVLTFTFVIEGTAALILFIRFIFDYSIWRALYLAIFHSVSAFNNAGFDLFGNSLEGFTGDIIVNFVIMALIVLGGIGFAVMAEIYDNKSIRKFTLQTKMVLIFTLLLIVIGFLSFLFLEYNNQATIGNLPFGEKLLASLFLSITPRTAGFNTVPTGQLQSSTLFLTIILMFIGASPGSTGGGIKTTTFGVLLMTVWNLIKGNDDIEVFKRRLEKDIVFKAVVTTFLALILVIVVTMILSITEGKAFISIMFETVSAFGTVGLSTGITSTLSRIGKALITFTMFVGRVGPLTLAMALAERTRKGVYHYPKENIMVG
ncbi:MAG: TrkH family potassium uptake protein [Halanaerobiaceae bacterium]